MVAWRGFYHLPGCQAAWMPWRLSPGPKLGAILICMCNLFCRILHTLQVKSKWIKERVALGSSDLSDLSFSCPCSCCAPLSANCRYFNLSLQQSSLSQPNQWHVISSGAWYHLCTRADQPNLVVDWQGSLEDIVCRGFRRSEASAFRNAVVPKYLCILKIGVPLVLAAPSQCFHLPSPRGPPLYHGLRFNE